MSLGPAAKSHFKRWAPCGKVICWRSPISSVTIRSAVPLIKQPRLQFFLEPSGSVVQGKCARRDPAKTVVRNQDYSDARFRDVQVASGDQNQFLEIRLSLRALRRQYIR